MERLFVLALLLVAPMMLRAQLLENFDDGNFTANPAWSSINAANWVIDNGRLRSNSAAASSTFALSTPSMKAVSAQWNFSLQLQFNPSGANYVDVYLLSEKEDITSSTNNGYFVRIGGTPDEISLFKHAGGTTFLLIDGRNGSVNKSNNTVKIKVIRDALNTWTLQRDTTGTGQTFFTEGIATDGTIITSSYFGIKITQSTTSFFNKHFFDDFYSGDIILDTHAPTIESITVLSATELEVSFSEKVEINSAETGTNYSVNNAVGSATSAVRLNDEKTVRLTFATPFTNGISSLLTVNNVADLFENVATELTKDFFFFEAVPISPKDIVFSEIFADPAPSIGMPEAEYVELYNRSNKIVDLAGWKFEDAISKIVLPDKLLFPGDYVVLVNTSAFSLFNNYTNTLAVNAFPVLTNTGEPLVLRDNLGQLIDSVNYSDTWYGNDDKKSGGYSLERINQHNFCVEDTENWSASTAENGGTPGFENSVHNNEPDTHAPFLEQVDVLSPTELLLVFNEKIEDSQLHPSQFKITPDVEITEAVFSTNSQRRVLLQLKTSLLEGGVYTILVTNINDCIGNPINTTLNQQVFGIPAIGTFKDLIITEIMADPSPVVALPEKEYIEIYNRSNKLLDLQNWQLIDGSGQATMGSYHVLPNEYVILCSSCASSTFDNAKNILAVPGFPSLSNTGEALILKNSTGELVDSVNYTDSWYRDAEKADGGWSLELIDRNATCAEESNWQVSEDVRGGSPGNVNSVDGIKPDLMGPRLLFAKAIDQFECVLLFDEKLEKTRPAKENFLITPSLPIASVSFTNPSLREIQIMFLEPMKEATLYTVHVMHVRDCAGNDVQQDHISTVFALPQETVTGDVLISELLFNPRPGGVDFIEVYNQSNKYLNSRNWILANWENETLVNSKKIDQDNNILYPHSFTVFTTNAAIVLNHYPQSKAETFLETDLPPMNDDEGSIALTDSSGKVLDFFIYSKAMHSALLKNEEGVSLERTSLTVDASIIENWKSGVAAAGFATPGYKNANSQGQTNSADEVNVEPEIFEPIVGQPNFTTIHYQFDNPGLTANTKIFDAQGRLVKQLTNNEILAGTGFFTWDGDQDDGTKARIGYYTLWMEVFDTSGFVKIFRKRIVVASRF